MNQKTILAIDDEPSVLEVIDFILSCDGHNVLLASSGEDALEIIKEQWVDVIILDLRMPILSGYFFANIFMDYTKNKDIKVMILSGDSLVYGDCSVDIPNSSIKMTKPFEPTEFKRNVNKLLC